MEAPKVANDISIGILAGITAVAIIGLIAELLPGIEAKMIVLTTFIIIIGWSLFFLFFIRWFRKK